MQLRLDLSDPRNPVAQGSAGSVAAPKGTGHIFCQGTCLGDVLRCKPDCVSVNRSSTIVTPTSTRWIANKGLVTGITIRRTQPRRCNVDVSYAVDCVDAGVASARVIFVTDHRKGHHPSPALSYC